MGSIGPCARQNAHKYILACGVENVVSGSIGPCARQNAHKGLYYDPSKYA